MRSNFKIKHRQTLRTADSDTEQMEGTLVALEAAIQHLRDVAETAYLHLTEHHI